MGSQKEPRQLELPFVREHERDLDYYWDRHFRHMSQLNKDWKNDNVYIYDIFHICTSGGTNDRSPSALKFWMAKYIHWVYSFLNYSCWVVTFTTTRDPNDKK